MPTTTSTKSYTVLELLGNNIQNGQKFKVSTDNGLYGTTVIKKEGTLVNERTGENLVLTGELLKSKFRSVITEQKITLEGLVDFYSEGKKIKIQVGDTYRYVQRKAELPEELKQLLSAIASPIMKGKVMTSDEVITFEELIKGDFYLVD
jgi:hypothetical protein